MLSVVATSTFDVRLTAWYLLNVKLHKICHLQYFTIYSDVPTPFFANAARVQQFFF